MSSSIIVLFRQEDAPPIWRDWPNFLSACLEAATHLQRQVAEGISVGFSIDVGVKMPDVKTPWAEFSWHNKVFARAYPHAGYLATRNGDDAMRVLSVGVSHAEDCSLLLADELGIKRQLLHLLKYRLIARRSELSEERNYISLLLGTIT